MFDSKTHLTSVQTMFGMRSLYESVCYCNRCGMCAGACPSYQQTLQEPFSARGRNQALRKMFGSKLKGKAEQKLLKEMVLSCTLCGRCTQYCPGKIPTAQHVLEIRRRAGINLLPATLFHLLRLRQTAPRWFFFLMKVVFLLRRMGIVQLISYIPGFLWLKHALEILPSSPKISELKNPVIQNPTLIYLPSFEAEFLMPELFEQTYELVCKKYVPLVWHNTSSGLFEYVYGDIRRARRLVRKLITQHARVGGGKLPLLTDSIDVYNFLKLTPQLFEGFPTLAQKAKHFADQVCFVTDFFPKKIVQKQSFHLPVQLMPAALFSVETSPQLDMQKILHTLFDKNFVECGYKDGSVPPFGYGFVKHTHAPAYALAAVQTVATHQIQTVFVMSGLAALELAFYLRKFYPTARAVHVVQLNG